MLESDNNGPGPTMLFRKLAQTGLGLLQNRSELLLVELQEEKARAIELLIWGGGLLFLGIMTMLLLTGTIIFLFPEEYRIYAAGGFTLLYLAGAIWVVFVLKALLKKPPFPETVAQVKKDREWLES